MLRSDGRISRIDPGPQRVQADPSPLERQPLPTSKGPKAICGLPAAIAAFPAMQGKPPAEVEVLARDLETALASYRRGDLSPAARRAFTPLDRGLRRYLAVLRASGWRTDDPVAKVGSEAIGQGSSAYASLIALESEACT